MTRVPFHPLGDGFHEGDCFTSGHSHGCKPSPHEGPKCTCTPRGEEIKIDGDQYLCLNRITDAGCPEHGLRNRAPEIVRAPDVMRVVGNWKGKDKL